MFLKRFFEESIAQASFIVGCTGEAAVIDPIRDIQQYIDAARAEGLKITKVTETHIHADYLSGSRELAAATGAELLVSDEGGPDWTYVFRDEPGVRRVKHGDTFRVGSVALKVLHTPGHTPEHISFLLTDTEIAEKPLGIFSGDFLFVGDVGRPDLLEKAAKIMGTMEIGARTLFKSLDHLREYGDSLMVLPGHGAGSACGKGMSGVPWSTLGYERATNWALKTDTEQGFVDEVLAGQPEPPKYFAMMKKLNREGAPVLGSLPSPPKLRADEMRGQLADIRPIPEYLKGHAEGWVNIPRIRSFVNWSGWLLNYDEPIIFCCDSQETANAAARDLALIGLDNVAGWTAVPTGSLISVDSIEAGQLADHTDGATVLDVRWAAEWNEGHVPGSVNVPLGYLEERIAEVPTDRPLIVHCLGGVRSVIACSLLQKHGFKDVTNLSGGWTSYLATGQEVERPELIAT